MTPPSNVMANSLSAGFRLAAQRALPALPVPVGSRARVARCRHLIAACSLGECIKGADVASVFAELIRAGLQELIEAEATETLGVGRYERTRAGPRTATGTGRRRCRRPAATST